MPLQLTKEGEYMRLKRKGHQSKEADRRKEFYVRFSLKHSVDFSVLIRLEVNFDPE